MSCENILAKEVVKSLLALDILSFSILPSILAFILAEGLTISEQAILAAFIKDVGDELGTMAVYISAQNAFAATDKPSTEEEIAKLMQAIKEMQQHNQEMQEQINYLLSKP